MNPPRRDARDPTGTDVPLDPTVQRIVDSSFDMVLTLDASDRVERVSTATAFPLEIPEAWTGLPIFEFLTAETTEKARELFDRARRSGGAPARHLNLSFPGSVELPVDVSAARLGDSRRLLVMGRSLRRTAEMQQRLIRAQQEMEQEYRQYRSAETRYQAVLAMTGDPILVADWDSLEVIQANEAAKAALGDGSDVSGTLPDILSRSAPARVRTFLDMYRDGESGSSFRDPDALGESELNVRRVEVRDRAALLVRLARPPGLSPSAPHGRTGSTIDPMRVLRALPDGIVVLGRAGAVRWLNPAFAELVQLDEPDVSSELSLSSWLDRPGATAAILLSTMSERGRLHHFRSSLRGELGLDSDVEISGARLDDDHWVLVVRPVGRRLEEVGGEGASLATRVSELSGMLGKAGLKELVGMIGDLVERHLIIAALEATGGNRTAAAELLMLSRQTLYSKLRDHEITDARNE